MKRVKFTLRQLLFLIKYLKDNGYEHIEFAIVDDMQEMVDCFTSDEDKPQ